jgi:membrane fusion protein, multidrug efflux system
MDQNIPEWTVEQIVPDWNLGAALPRVNLLDAAKVSGLSPAGRVADELDAVISRPGLRRLRRRRRLLLAGAALLAAAILGVGGWRWWEATKFLVSTDDAYLESDSVTVSPQVAGTIATLDVADNQAVRAGQVLAVIDDRPFRAALAKAQADVASAEAKLGDVGAEIAEQVANVASSRAVIAADHAAVGFAQADATRYARLSRTGFGTVQTAERTAAALSESEARLTRDEAALTAAERQIGVLAAERAMAAASLKAAEAEQQSAALNLSYTVIKAPVTGVVGDRGVRLGAYVAPGTPLLQVVPMGGQIYLTANFKETDLARMKTGEPVSFTVDTFPGHEFRGTVESLAPGSGSQFALLPPENATGNFTKIVQRVPVKIVLAASDPLVGKLRPGLSVEATVNTAAPPSSEPVALAEDASR